MADGSSQGSGGMEAKPDKLTREDLEIVRRTKLAHWAKNSWKMRTKNIMTGLAIGGVALAIYGYTFFSVSQEKFLDELENEAKIVRANAPKTSAN